MEDIGTRLDSPSAGNRFGKCLTWCIPYLHRIRDTIYRREGLFIPEEPTPYVSKFHTITVPQSARFIVGLRGKTYHTIIRLRDKLKLDSISATIDWLIQNQKGAEKAWFVSAADIMRTFSSAYRTTAESNIATRNSIWSWRRNALVTAATVRTWFVSWRMESAFQTGRRYYGSSTSPRKSCRSRLNDWCSFTRRRDGKCPFCAMLISWTFLIFFLHWQRCLLMGRVERLLFQGEGVVTHCIVITHWEFWTILPIHLQVLFRIFNFMKTRVMQFMKQCRPLFM